MSPHKCYYAIGGRGVQLIPRAFEYHAPATLREATALLRRYGSEAKVLAGGQSLVPLMKLRLASPEHVVDINRLPGLDSLRVQGDDLVLGALLRHHTIARSPLVQAHCPILAAAAEHIGDPQVRNRGTLGGSVAHADPAADYPPVLVALEGTIVTYDGRRTRGLAAVRFFLDYFVTPLKPAELVTAVRVPRLTREWRWAYLKYERGAGDFAIVAVAIVLRRHGERVTAVRIGLGGVGSTPVRARAAEAYLVGQRGTQAEVREAAGLAARSLDPPGDIRGSSRYRKAMAEVFVERALIHALRRR